MPRHGFLFLVVLGLGRTGLTGSRDRSDQSGPDTPGESPDTPGLGRRVQILRVRARILRICSGPDTPGICLDTQDNFEQTSLVGVNH